jgi:hypothetical protein
VSLDQDAAVASVTASTQELLNALVLRPDLLQD